MEDFGKSFGFTELPCMQAANFMNLALCQSMPQVMQLFGMLRRPMGRSIREASLANRILRIVLGGPKKQVHWVHTEAIVAAMADTHANRDRSVRKQPRIAVRLIQTFPGVELAVAFGVQTCRPSPATLRLVDFTPEQLIRRFREYISHCARIRTVALAIGWRVKDSSTRHARTIAHSALRGTLAYRPTKPTLRLSCFGQTSWIESSRALLACITHALILALVRPLIHPADYWRLRSV